jgi:hypothetical protein
MKCPHCTITIHSHESSHGIGDDPEGTWWIAKRHCPSCRRLILYLVLGEISDRQKREISRILIRPKSSARVCPPEVPDLFAEDYKEACLVLPDSHKASAALSRRCLQNLIREKAGIRARTLADEIQQLLDSGTLPSYIAEVVDSVRNIGNFAAHPIKSQTTGEIVPIEPGEAEWNLDVLEALFDFYFVQPARVQRRKDTLNQKLQDTGKPLMK